LPLFGFVLAAAEAVVHFPNPLSKFKLGAFRTSRKLGLFVQVGMISFESLVLSFELDEIPACAGITTLYSGLRVVAPP
jgi:hypothetical protein